VGICPSVRPDTVCPIPRRCLLAPTRRAPYMRLSLLAPATPLLSLVCALDQYLSHSLFLCLGSAKPWESRAPSCHSTTLLASLGASSSSSVSDRSPLPLTGRANQAAAMLARRSRPSHVARQLGEGLWLGIGQAQAQLAAARPCHYPRPLAGQSRTFPPLCAASYGRMVKNACCKCMFEVFQMFHRHVSSVP
jgi:hypothetical protein